MDDKRGIHRVIDHMVITGAQRNYLYTHLRHEDPIKLMSL
ncbi:MAG: hypothetical protein PWP32_660 [Methanothermobacter sp.]|jgi:hypothetical protein|uniref:Uncharacterized protein n=1 Tax=Methanothermobacter defluvii TaxID=49339 RepID=A0A371NC88_9EURY|nr:hypothetical protein [Methanothermobacter sp.]MDN5373895.1 hypothetical protein [Methanothermobacter sp.]REE28125.1 hypothetical protein C7452_0124 [Methanothermobacter defluvii]